MPALNTVLNWVKDDRDGFAARYRAARSTGNAGRPSRYTREIADWLLGELSAGRRLREICSDAGMPSANTVRLWAAQDRDGFAARFRNAAAAGRAGLGRPTLYNELLAGIILAELGAGRTLTDVCSDPDMPSDGAVRLWVIEDRDGFAARYADAREFGDEIMVDQMIDIADRRQHWIVRLGPDGETEVIRDTQSVRRDRLRIEARRWRLTRSLTRKYGKRAERMTPR